VPATASRPARVGFLLATLSIGGAERLVQSLVTGMDRTRVESTSITLYGPGRVGEELLAAGQRVVHGLARSFTDPGAGRRLGLALARERIDVLYVCDSPLPLFWSGMQRRRSPRPPLVLGFHSTGRRERRLQHFLANRAALPVVDRFVALADSHLGYLVKHFGLPRERGTVIVSGVDLDTFAPAADRDAIRRELGLPVGVPLAGIVAALRPEKHHAMFVAAAARVHARLPAARFLVVGEGPERPLIEAAIARHDLQDVVLMLGARDDVPRLMRALDVAVLTSHPFVETLPVCLLEAHACGVPSLATDVGSLRDVVAEGETGFLVPSGDVEAFAGRLGELLGSPGLRARMSVAARARAEQRVDRRAMMRSYEDLFVKLAGTEAGR
jgi:glycosyltransferase involved in cell wall biosynthesis